MLMFISFPALVNDGSTTLLITKSDMWTVISIPIQLKASGHYSSGLGMDNLTITLQILHPSM